MNARTLMTALLSCGWLAACAPDDPSVTTSDDGALRVGEARVVELRFLRFDVSNFEKRLTRADILAMPSEVRERMWLFDLDLSSGSNSPQLIDNALAAIRALDPAQLGPAERNMQTLMNMTPDTANLTGSALERLIELAPLMGVAPEQVLADLFHINVEEPFLSDQVVAQAILELVIGTHPNAQTRLGPETAAHPDGVYPVKPGAVPISLDDVVSDFASFGKRFGPYARDGVEHPGFVAGKTSSNVLTEDFALTVRANANALPYKGIDLTSATSASVNSVRSQIEALFDFDDPNWLRVEGLIEGVPNITSLTFRITEADRFVAGGRSPVPAAIGNSAAWQLPRFNLERVLIGAAQNAFQNLNSQIAYAAPGRDPLFEATVADGWHSIVVQGGLGSPPPPSYVWDLLLEIAQVRLHDGGLAEGEANVEFTLEDVPLGTDTATLKELMRDNLRDNPLSLVGVAQELIDTTEGEADFYFYRASPGNQPSMQGDWLFFITPSDIAQNDEQQPLRPYRYAHPGFYGDAALTKKLSDVLPLDGDTEHEKIRLDDHPVLYVEDDAGVVYRLTAGRKPSPNRRDLTIVRVR
jgi:hypothetical protein